MSKRYMFTVYMFGNGNDENSAYDDALSSFATDPGEFSESAEVCKYCNKADCNFGCDESQAGGFSSECRTA